MAIKATVANLSTGIAVRIVSSTNRDTFDIMSRGSDKAIMLKIGFFFKLTHDQCYTCNSDS